MFRDLANCRTRHWNCSPHDPVSFRTASNAFPNGQFTPPLYCLTFWSNHNSIMSLLLFNFLSFNVTSFLATLTIMLLDKLSSICRDRRLYLLRNKIGMHFLLYTIHSSIQRMFIECLLKTVLQAALLELIFSEGDKHWTTTYIIIHY